MSTSTSPATPLSAQDAPQETPPNALPETPGRSSSSSESPGEALPPTHQAPGHDDSSRRGLPIWLFVVLFLIFALVSGWQYQVVGELETEIAGLESELAETTALLGAHQTRLVEIRGGVRDLASQLEGLKALVDAEPGDTLSAPHPSGDASSTSTSDASNTSYGSYTSDAQPPVQPEPGARTRAIPARLPR